ncbi:unnamed protein product [Moneuplotes crassus]|uniref:Peroxisomal biogenesis factor 11 n=1 Tax=Euplotes crassus TaxID=5936 RepID=A0AAD1XPV7_EUPCR|nr:unnamed protein product [Moneuplotes crassus]
MDKLIAFTNKTEGRDKFCKAVQYGARVVKWYLEGKDEELKARFTGLFNNMKTARKLFRLFKSVNEYQKIMNILGKGAQSQTDIINAASRLCFLLYWFFDNLVVLSSVKFLNYDAKQMNKYGAFWWLCGLILGQAVAFIKLSELADQEAALRKKERNDETKKALVQIQAKKFTEYLNIIKQAGDMITSSQAIELPAKFGFNFNDGAVGMGGFVSAVVTMYQLYP